MPAAQETRQRSESQDLDDSDDSDDQHPNKPGRRKNPNSQAARRDQNRIAQREFRLRKQQRIRDLEARVEILSGGKDEAMGEMRLILKDLMQENMTLRNLLRGLGTFIGEGAGGLLPKLGWDVSDFNTYLNRSETDTAWEGYQRRKKTGTTAHDTMQNVPSNGGSSAQPTAGPSQLPSLKRTSESDLTHATNKRHKGREDSDQANHPLMMPTNSLNTESHTMFPPSGGRNSYDNSQFSHMLRTTNGSPLFMQSPPSNTGNSFSNNMPTPPGTSRFEENYLPSMNIGSSSNAPLSMPYTSPQQQHQHTPQQQPKAAAVASNDDDSEDSNKNEAYKLIHYHLDNYKRNTAYCLPSSLRPTLVQRTVPHESVIDRILHPELRDRMILLRGRFDLVDCLLDYRNAVIIHGDDVLNHANWEIGEKWLRPYGFLVDQATLNVTNKWRRERGESDLKLSDFATAEPSPAASGAQS
ncbi:hypothetical protein BDV98DRAFT_105076 [Pterulicium gracile]|uniref:BZIP domain-containing protein n=1 Tax=Pterulicium gracile TaxID=1884261 RepID=A0A5C3QQF5_9AGAR|nr:hypothetical protein BDV98DRAFT_105076 [Pterula gracilis]